MRDRKYIFSNFIITYCGIFYCYTSLQIKLTTRQIKDLKIFKIITYMGCFASICLIPNAVKTNFSHIQLNVKNPLIAYAITITICLRLCFLLMVILMKENRDGQLIRWCNKLWSIQVSYFERFESVPADVSLRKFVTAGVVLMIFHGFTLCGGLWQTYLLGKIWKFFDIYLLCCIINYQHYILCHHTLLLNVLYEDFSKLNYQLKHHEMDSKLCLIYYQLTELVAELNTIYGPIILCLQLCLIITNGIVGYVLTLYLDTSNMNLEAYAYLLGGHLYILMFVHMCLYFKSCDRTSTAARQTVEILKEFNAKDEATEIEIISLNLLLTKGNCAIKGMFKMDLNNFFSIIAKTILLTIVLVQVDLQNK